MAALAVAVVLVTAGVAAPAGAGAAPTTGHAWAPVTPSSTYNVLDSVLDGVSAVSGSNAWAVGSYTDTSALASKTLILRWNGTAWTQVKSPSPSSFNDNSLNGVSARSGSDAWAVGSYVDTTGASKTLILHWNGTAVGVRG